MKPYFRKNYWRWGFKSKLYDLLTPESYSRSLKRSVECVPDGAGGVWLDAGCGSGQLLFFLKERWGVNFDYLGTDLLMAGLNRLAGKAGSLGISDRVRIFQADLTQALPLKSETVDVIIAHFSVYTIKAAEKRRRIFKEFSRVLKPGGILVSSNPSKEYNSRDIIRDSLKWLKNGSGFGTYLVKKWMVYPFTRHLGLKLIERQLQAGQWRAYSLEEFRAEIEGAGFTVEHSESVYGGSGHLIQAKSPNKMG